MTKSGDPAIRRIAIDTAVQSAALRAVRETLSTMPIMAAIPSPARQKHRLIYDMNNIGFSFFLPGTLVFSEGDDPNSIKDEAVREAFDFSGITYDFYREVLSRNSLDDRGMSLISSVHFGRNYNNAFWNGEQMAYGDGDNRIFVRFSKSLEVVGHELSHGVVQHTSNLEYQGEPGALNEHFADVMGALVTQWHKGENVRDADWLVGNEIMGPEVKAKAIRTFTEEKAFENDPILGTDPQPKHMRDIYTGDEDNGGVHINSGIPNHAFHIAALDLGGKSWEKAGPIWYKTLKRLDRFSKFQDAANISCQVASTEFGSGSLEFKAVQSAWKAVGIEV
jgi:Zn-dependent metalloprotease